MTKTEIYNMHNTLDFRVKLTQKGKDEIDKYFDTYGEENPVSDSVWSIDAIDFFHRTLNLSSIYFTYYNAAFDFIE